MATSFLSVTIVGTQPHNTATTALAESVAMTSTRDALSRHDTLPVLKRATVADRNDTTRAD
jgi:hypothetical protein